MAVTFSFNVPIGSGASRPTGNVNVNGAGINFDLSRDSNLSNSNIQPQTYRDMLNLGSVSGAVSNNRTRDVGNILSTSSPSNNISSGNSSDFIDRILTIGGVASPIIGALINRGSAESTNATNQSIANFNLEAIERANRENIAFQKRENAITRLREDNAFQRAAKDLQMAGLSKTLAAGSPASASSLTAPSVSPETNQFHYQDPMARIDLANTLMSAFRTMSDIDNNRKLTDAQVANLNSQARYTNINADTLRIKNESDIAYTKQLTAASYASQRYTDLQSFFLKKYGDDKELAQIEYIISNRDLNYSNIGVNSARVRQIAQDVVESMARTENMSYEKQKLIKELAIQALNLNILKYDFGISQELAIRSSDKLPTFFGFPAGAFASALSSITGLGKSVSLKNFVN